MATTKTPGTKSSSLLSERYVALVRELMQERDADAHGAQSSVARLLDVSKSYLSKILAGERRPGVAVAERAAGRLNMKMNFFTSTKQHSYREFLQAGPANLPVGTLPNRLPGHGPVREALAGEERRWVEVLVEAHALRELEMRRAPPAPDRLERFLEQLHGLRFVAAHSRAATTKSPGERLRLARDAYLSLSEISTPLDIPAEALVIAGLDTKDNG